MANRLYPRGRAEYAAAAQHLYAQMTDPDADAFFLDKAQTLAADACTLYLSALDAHRAARAAASIALDAQDAADQASDAAGAAFFKAVRLNCAPSVDAELRTLLGGRSPSTVMKSPHRTQLYTLDVFFGQLDARTDLKVPGERLQTWREAHEAMREAVQAVSAAESRQRAASAAADEAEASFAEAYRTLVQHLTLLWGEESTQATLLGFAAPRRRAAAGGEGAGS